MPAPAPNNKAMSMDRLKQMAIRSAKVDSTYKVNEQIVSKRYDMKTQEAYYFVLTEFEQQENGSLVVESFKYIIK